MDSHSNEQLREMILARQRGSLSGPVIRGATVAPLVAATSAHAPADDIGSFGDHDGYDGLDDHMLSGTELYARQAFRVKHLLFSACLVAGVGPRVAADDHHISIFIFAIPCCNSDVATQETQVFESTGKSVVVCVRFEGAQQYLSCSCSVRDEL